MLAFAAIGLPTAEQLHRIALFRAGRSLTGWPMDPGSASHSALRTYLVLWLALAVASSVLLPLLSRLYRPPLLLKVLAIMALAEAFLASVAHLLAVSLF
jgi:hypothetical protein